MFSGPTYGNCDEHCSLKKPDCMALLEPFENTNCCLRDRSRNVVINFW